MSDECSCSGYSEPRWLLFANTVARKKGALTTDEGSECWVFRIGRLSDLDLGGRPDTVQGLREVLTGLENDLGAVLLGLHALEPVVPVLLEEVATELAVEAGRPLDHALQELRLLVGGRVHDHEGDAVGDEGVTHLLMRRAEDEVELLRSLDQMVHVAAGPVRALDALGSGRRTVHPVVVLGVAVAGLDPQLLGHVDGGGLAGGGEGADDDAHVFAPRTIELSVNVPL